MRRYLTTLLDLAGVSAIVGGVYLVSLPAALIVAGLGLLAMSWRASA
jgi:hypothetical protein